MKAPLRLALRFVAIAATLAVVATLLVPSPRIGSPYVSALADVWATPALARGGCEFKACAGGSRHNIVCAQVVTATICTTYKGTCVAAGCP